ncbi:MAG: hypothetical protein WA432_01835 [Candidatus Babeliaceae bacterium]
MKSIMQEASSISKAIEQGWIKAGRPQEFTIKILEEPQTNLMGLITTRSAKIALFFDEGKPTVTAQPKARPLAPRIKEQPSERPAIQKVRQHRKQEETTHIPKNIGQQRNFQKSEPLWNDQMIQVVRSWLDQMLALMGASAVKFTLEPQNFYVRITLSQPILSEADREKHLLASFSTLILETLKKQFKTSLRGHKIVLTHQ